jgi:hypothetical protein
MGCYPHGVFYGWDVSFFVFLANAGSMGKSAASILPPSEIASLSAAANAP